MTEGGREDSGGRKDEPQSGGRKDDQGKPDFSLIPEVPMVEEAKGFMLGERKYGRDNYKKGLSKYRILAAAARHLWKLLSGEEIDPESGASHAGHIRCCMAMYLECKRLGTLGE